ncbi:MAG: S8 family peptidase [bacterium]|nr:S8 family peptidase [bacterium]
MKRSTLWLLALTCLAGVALAIPPQGGPENGYRPTDVIDPGSERFLGQTVVKFNRSFPDAYNPKGEPVQLGDASLDAIFAKYGVYFAKNLVPWEIAPTEKCPIDLRWTFLLHFPTENSIDKIVEELQSLPFVGFAEPNFYRKVDRVPNDPYFSAEWHISTIHAPLAYDYTTGDSTIVISIIDSGVEHTHQDLINNRWVNPGEDLNGDGIIQTSEINGIDDDGNLRVDDFYGWDWTSSDNNPQDPFPWPDGGHGTHVAGCASARTDNGIGVASPARVSKIMANRCAVANNPNLINSAHGFSAMSYSSLYGANIINNSWGGSQYSQNEQNSITTIWNRGLVVVGAAGNDNVSSRHYPGGYTNSIAVAATGSGDDKASFSNYGTWVNISAPGETIWSTVNTSTTSYDNAQGTSMASPVVAGCVAMLWSVMPGASNLDVRTILMETATNIDAQNPGYIGQLGVGRVDIGAAVSSRFPLLSLDTVYARDTIAGQGNGNGRIEAGETINLIVRFSNAGDRTDSYSTTLRFISTDPTITVLSDSVWIGDVLSGNNGETRAIRFRFNAGSPSHRTNFTLRVSGLNPNDLRYTQTFNYDFMLGYGNTMLIDDDNGATYENYYKVALDSLGESYDYWNIATQGVPTSSDMSRYYDFIWFTGDATTNTITTAEQTAISWIMNNNRRLLLSGKEIGEEIGSSSFHQNVLHATYVASSSQTRANGIAGDALSGGGNLLLVGSSGAGNYSSSNALTPVGGAVARWNYTNGNTGAISYSVANRIRLVYCGFPVESIHGSASTITRWAFLSRVLTAFRNTAVGEETDGALPTDFQIQSVYPNPFNPSTTIAFSLPRSSEVKLSVYDVSGRLVANLGEKNYTAGFHSLQWNASNVAAGMYIVRMEAAGTVSTHKALLMK